MSEKEAKCWRCKKSSEYVRLAHARTQKNGTITNSYICRPCNTEYHREIKRKKGPEYVREISKRTYEKHKEKWLARAKVNYALKTGKLTKAERCEVCELKKPLQGHHPDYSKPLEVIWLCSGCHADEHKVLKEELLTPEET